MVGRSTSSTRIAVSFFNAPVCDVVLGKAILTAIGVFDQMQNTYCDVDLQARHCSFKKGSLDYFFKRSMDENRWSCWWQSPIYRRMRNRPLCRNLWRRCLSLERQGSELDCRKFWLAAEHHRHCFCSQRHESLWTGRRRLSFDRQRHFKVFTGRMNLLK